MSDKNSDDNTDKEDNFENMSKYQIVFIGAPCSGKTCIICQITENYFNENTEAMISIDFCNKIISFRDKKIKLLIWDTSGLLSHRGHLVYHIINSSLIFLIYDVSDKDSFDKISEWVLFIRSIRNVPMVLCGTKIDLKGREIKREEGENLAYKEGMRFFEVSAKTGEGIKNMFYSSIADLPIFGKYNIKKDFLIKELILENEGENEDYEIKQEKNEKHIESTKKTKEGITQKVCRKIQEKNYRCLII